MRSTRRIAAGIARHRETRQWGPVSAFCPCIARHFQRPCAPLLQNRSAVRGFSISSDGQAIDSLLRSLSPQDLNSFESIIKDVESNPNLTGERGIIVLKIGGEVVEKELDVLAKNVIFLQRAGYSPVIVHGAGPQLNEELAKQNVQPNYISGMRVTDANTLLIAQQVFKAANTALVEAINESGGHAEPLTEGVFLAEQIKHKPLGFVGEVTSVRGDLIRASLTKGCIPVLTSLGESVEEEKQKLNINADVAAREVALFLQPVKTVFINAKGGWLEGDKKLQEINLYRDYDEMASRDYTGRQGTLLKLVEMKKILDPLPATSTMSLTSATGLQLEVLPRGVGTTVHKGEPLVAGGVSGKHSEKLKVGILGARGYVGREFIRLLAGHPHLELVCASSRALVGQSVVEVASRDPQFNVHEVQNVPSVDEHDLLPLNRDLLFCDLEPGKVLEGFAQSPEVDVWVLALPNGLCDAYVPELLSLRRDKKPILIDLSADKRFDDSGDWVYGLPELPGMREKLRRATFISNPGCYATGGQLGLAPLVFGNFLRHESSPSIFGLSGYSGAGTSPSPKNDPSFLRDNIVAYSSVAHIHEREMTRHLGSVPVAFMPHVAPYFQGIHLTISAHLAKDMSKEAVQQLYYDFYKDERFVQVIDDVPSVRDIVGKPIVEVGGIHYDSTNQRVALVSTIDNLMKGAATQAMQNINLALGFPESDGL